MIAKKKEKKKILIFNDEPDITSALKMYLESQGFHTTLFDLNQK